MNLLLVLAGGALGAPARYLADSFIASRHHSAFPWGTFVVNVVGSLVLGAVAAAVSVSDVPESVQIFVGTGFCGALTTFSTFGFEAVRLLEDRRSGIAMAYVGGALALVGVAVARRKPRTA